VADDHERPSVASLDPGTPLAGFLFKGLHDKLLVLHGHPRGVFSSNYGSEDWPSEIGLKYYSRGDVLREVG
jgi:hypothetical protein